MFKLLFKWVLPVIVLAGGGWVSWQLYLSGPTTEARLPEPSVQVVDVLTIRLDQERPQWVAGGTVRAAEQVNLVAQVGGEIVDLNPLATPGALLDEGEWLAQVEKDDYATALAIQQALLVQAQSEFALEKGQQVLAREEFALASARKKLSKDDRALVLREPQIASAKARVRKVQSDLKQAKLNLQRTRITMPFRGQLIDRHIGRGSQVSVASTLYEIINVDRFWVEVKVPRNFLNWIDSDIEALVHQPNAWGPERSRRARIVSIRPDVDKRDRQAKILLEITDPLSLSDPALPQVLVNDFVEATLFGRSINQAAVLSPGWLFDERYVWVVNDREQLEERRLDVVFTGRGKVFVNAGLREGDRVVVNRLDIAAPGMPVRPRERTPRPPQTGTATGGLF